MYRLCRAATPEADGAALLVVPLVVPLLLALLSAAVGLEEQPVSITTAATSGKTVYHIFFIVISLSMLLAFYGLKKILRRA
jgi:hypothetical protein